MCDRSPCVPSNPMATLAQDNTLTRIESRMEEGVGRGSLCAGLLQGRVLSNQGDLGRTPANGEKTQLEPTAGSFPH